MNKTKKNDNRKRAAIIVKISMKKLPDGRDHCVKYKVTNYTSFFKFIDKKYPEWVWANGYVYVSGGKGERIFSCSKKANNMPCGHVV